MKLTLRCITVLLLANSILLLLAHHAAARAGGGEGYHGGGGGGGGGGGFGGHGGGGGGNGGGGQLIFDLIYFCFRNPAVGVPLAIIVVVVVIYLQRQSVDNGPSLLETDPSAFTGRRPATDPIATVRAHDPAFNPAEFSDRVGNGFLKLQAAWCTQNLQQVRPFISDGIHERFSLQFAEQKAEGYRDQMDNIAIQRIVVTDAASDDIYDSLSVRISASAADYRVSMRDGRPVQGHPGVEPFTEIWSFLRRRGASTVPGKLGLLEGNCPNCGAPIAINESANCTNCNALLRSGQYDWVLSEITQASEWNRGSGATVPGLANLRQRDPDLNVQSLEDRVSVIFWRKAAADRLGKLDPMFKVTSPDYGQAYAARLKSPPGSPRVYFAECAVGSVNVLGFTTNATSDEVAVEVRWSGVKVAVQPDRTLRPIEPNSPHHTLFVLKRKAGAKTDVAKGISSAHCPSCGAPESGGTTGACEFCGTALNDGSNGWVLYNILGFSDPQAVQLLSIINSSSAGR